MTPLDRLDWVAGVMVDHGLSAGSLRVAGVLATMVNGTTGSARPGLEFLARECGLHRSTIARSLGELERADHLEKSRGGGRGKPSEWRLILSQHSATVSDPGNGETVAPGRDSLDGLGADTVAPGRDSLADTVAPGRDSLAPETVAQTVAYDATLTGVNRGKDLNLPPIVPLPSPNGSRWAPPDWVPRDAWMGYEEMRTKIRKPMTNRARTLAIGKLEKLWRDGHMPTDVLDQSVLHGWQGLFPIRTEGKPNGTNDSGTRRLSAVEEVEQGNRERAAARERDRGTVGQAGENVRPPLEGEFRRER